MAKPLLSHGVRAVTQDGGVGGSKHCGAGSGLRGRGGLSQWLLGGQRRNNHGVGGHQNLGIIQCEGLPDSGPELVSFRSTLSHGY